MESKTFKIGSDVYVALSKLVDGELPEIEIHIYKYDPDSYELTNVRNSCEPASVARQIAWFIEDLENTTTYDDEEEV